MIMAMLTFAGATVGCDEDEVKVHRESETTTTTQEMMVTP